MNPFNETEAHFKGRYSSSVIDTLYQAYLPRMKFILLTLLLGFIGRILLLGNANLLGIWVDSFCAPPSPCKPIPAFFEHFSSGDYVLGLLILTTIGFGLTLLFRIGVSRLSADAVSTIYDETTLRTSRLPMTFFDRNPSGRIMTRFSGDYNNIFRIFGGPLAEFFSLIFDLLAMTFLIGLASPLFLPFWFLLVCLNYLVYRTFLPTLREQRREVSRKRSPGIAHFAESVSGASAIRAYGREDSFKRRFTFLNDSFLHQRWTATRAFILFALSMATMTGIVFLLMGLSGIFLIREGWLSVGSMGVAFTYLALSTTILNMFFEWLTQFEEAMTGLERMNEYLRHPLEPGAVLPQTATFQTGHVLTQTKTHPQPSLGIQTQALEPQMGLALEVRDLWLRYRPDLPPVLKGIDLSIAAGEKIAIIGKTGSGKSSLVQALFYLYPFERGSIQIGDWSPDLLGDHPPGTLPLTQYRSLVSYVTQDPTLFVGTLRSNLTTVQESLSDSELVSALRRVQFLDPSSEEKDFYKVLNLPIEERGKNLSAGERQLICMARCLIQKSPLVIFDEATSSVDPNSEAILSRAIEDVFSKRTQLIIAHRLSTIKHCDRVVWIHEGKVHRIGNTEKILDEFKAFHPEN